MRIQLLILLIILYMVASVAALEITAVSPSTATPGATITLTGGPFADGDTVLVGDRQLVADQLTPTRLNFTLPALASGEYALAVAHDGERSPRNFVLRVVQAAPRITALSPATLDSCAAASERQVTVSGNSFRSGANLLVDNTSIAIDELGATEITLILPVLKPGLHQVQVVNPDNQRSLAYGLFISSTPELMTVETGDDRVSDYDLILKGKNFLFNSQLTANGVTVGKTLDPSISEWSPRGMMRYVDCNTLIYTRRPFLRDVREISLQVINPGGEQSNVYQLTTP